MTTKERASIYLVGFGVGLIVAVTLFLRVARDAIRPEAEDAVSTRFLEELPEPLPDRYAGQPVYRIFEERVTGEPDRLVVAFQRERGEPAVRLHKESSPAADWNAVRGDCLRVVPKPAIPEELMRDGFRNTGFEVLEGPLGERGHYLVRVNPVPVDSLARARYFLVGRERFVSAVEFVEVE